MADAFSQNVDVSARPRIVLYHQTLHLEGRHVSLLPLLSFSAGITHFIIAALHLNGPRAPNPVHLNDLPPDHPSFDELWQDCAELQRHGTKLLIMLGGAAKGTFALLDGETEMFECQYSLLRQVIVTHCFDGIDLDVEEKMSLRGISRLIDRLRQDFGTSFIISLAPIATAMYGGRNLSGFNYVDLEEQSGSKIDFYNVQFYNNHGSLRSADTYKHILARGWPSQKIVVGCLTSWKNGYGWQPFSVLRRVWNDMRATAGTINLPLSQKANFFGGIMAWEYFNSLPAGTQAPYQWSCIVSRLLGQFSAS